MYNNKENEWLDSLVINLSELLNIWGNLTNVNLVYEDDGTYMYKLLRLYLSAFNDYFDEYVYLLSENRHTLLVQSSRCILETYVLLNTLLFDEDGVDILANMADKNTVRTKKKALSLSECELKDLIEIQIKELDEEIKNRKNEKSYSISGLIGNLPKGRLGINRTLSFKWSYYSEHIHVGWKNEIKKRPEKYKSLYDVDFIKTMSNTLTIIMYELNFLIFDDTGQEKFIRAMEKCFRLINKVN